MTVDQRQKIQHAIQALIDVESALQQTEGAQREHIKEVEGKLSEARKALIDLNAPQYN